MISAFFNYFESFIRFLLVHITNWLPVKIIRDDNGVPFLYRYHLFALTNDGPGMCIHHFVKSDPDRGYHDHPWNKSLSFILCGGYDERILDRSTNNYNTIKRNRWNFNYLKGENVFHRVMLDDGHDAWTIFAFQKRNKIWNMIDLDGNLKQMSTTISDKDGGWWNHVMKGLGVHSHLKKSGNVIATVDIIVIANSKILLIKRGKDPYKGFWAFPGGRIEEKDMDILEAAKRELYEETNIKNINLKYVKTIGNNFRDSRGFCLTNVFMVELDNKPDNIKAGDDAVDYMWHDLNDLPEMAFDHKQILGEIKN